MGTPLHVLRNSIRAKLIMGTIAIVLVVVCALTYIIARNAATLLEEEASAQLSQLLNQSSAILRSFLEVREANLDLWAADPLIHSVADDPALAAVFLPGLQDYFSGYSDKEPWIDNIYVINNNEAIYAHREPSVFPDNAPVATEELPKAAKAILELAAGRLAILRPGDSGSPGDQGMIALKQPLMREGEAIEGGFIVVLLDPEAIQQALFGGVRAGQNGFLALVARAGSTLDTDGLWIPQRQGGSPEHNDFAAAARQGLLLTDAPRQYQSIVLDHRALSESPLAIVGVAALRDVREPVNQMIYISVGFGTLVLLLGVIAALIFSGRLTAPIRLLTDRARRFAAGELEVERRHDDRQPQSEGNVPARITSRDEIGELASAFDQMAVDISELLAKVRRQNAAFERFVPTEFLRHLGKNAVEDVGLGEVTRKDLSVLFSDIRNFTGLAETMTPEENFRFLNTYLTYIGPIIDRHGGFIDKFVGDAIMALFAGDKHGVADDAVEAAVGIAEQLQHYNQDLERRGRTPIAAGIGVHTGTLMLGTIGFERRMDSTVIGDTVNVAARIEGLTKRYATPIAISKTTYQHLRDPAAFLIREVDTVQVRGREHAVTIYEVFNTDPEPLRERKSQSLTLYREALELYKHQRWQDAVSLFAELQSKLDSDRVTSMYLERCRQFQAQPPDTAWNGVTVLEEK